MSTIRLAIISLIVLISISCFTPQLQVVVSQFTLTTVRVQLPDLDTMKRYINNLIGSYNAFVDRYDKPRSDFANIKAYFSLYLEAGNSFKVIVIQTDPYQANQISLIFIPIRADQPNVTMDYKDTFGTLFPNMTETFGFPMIQENLPFTYNGTVVRQDLVLGIQASDVSGDYMTNSYNAAKAIYHQDQSEVPTISQTQTVSQTISQTTTIQSLIQSPFVSELTSLTNEIVGGIISIVAAALILGEHRRRKKPKTRKTEKPTAQLVGRKSPNDEKQLNAGIKKKSA